MEYVKKSYLPAAGRDWALPLYDPLVMLLGAGAAREKLLEQVSVQSLRRVLDIGCGTGTFAVMIKRLSHGTDVIGLDPDPKALARARLKAQRAGVSVRLDQGYSDALPYTDAFFDAVFSSFMFHHLQPEDRERSLREVQRVLAPGGSLHLLDFEQPETERGLVSWFHFRGHLQDNSESRLLALFRRAGFKSAKKVRTGSMLFGFLQIGYYQASMSDVAS